MLEPNEGGLPPAPIVTDDPPEVPEHGEPETPTPEPPKGGIPYKQYHDLLTEKKDLERQIETLTNNPPPPSADLSEEGQAIVERYVKPLETKIGGLEDQIAVKDLVIEFPQLKPFQAEFEEYRQAYPRHKLANVAKLFLQEKGLLESAPRPGLEKPTGGPKIQPKTGMSVEEVRNLRENNPKKYAEMVRKGQIQISE